MPYDPIADGCVVALWDAWGRALRSLVLSCAAGPFVTLDGTVHSPGRARAESEALLHLEQRKQQRLASYALAFPNSGEPKWYIVANVEEIGNTLEIPLASRFGAALNCSSLNLESGITLVNPVRTVQTVRNYIAHKSFRNLNKVEGVIPEVPEIDLCQHLRSRTSGGSTVFQDWADAMISMFEGAIE